MPPREGNKFTFEGKTFGKESPARSIGKLEDIRMYITQMGLEDVASIHLVWDRGK